MLHKWNNDGRTRWKLLWRPELITHSDICAFASYVLCGWEVLHP